MTSSSEVDGTEGVNDIIDLVDGDTDSDEELDAGGAARSIGRTSLFETPTTQRHPRVVKYQKYNLKYILDECADFKDEMSLIQYTLKLIGGCGAKFTPKCHPELAGEGIEYDWGCSKRYFRKRRSEVAGSIKWENFLELVKDSLRQISMEKALRYARRAGMYKVGYWMLLHKKTTPDASEGVVCMMQNVETTIKLLKAKTYKQHRGVSASTDVLMEGE